MTRFLAHSPETASRTRESGSVATETAMIAVPFLLILISIFELALLMMAANAVQAAANEAAIRGRDLEDPAAVVTSWSTARHAFPFAELIAIDFECFSGAQALAAEEPESPCENARVVAWTASTNWHAVTPMINWAFPQGINLTARGVSYR